MTVSAGELRHRIDIVRSAKTPTGRGGFTETVATIAGNVAAKVEGLTGTEAVKEKVLRGVRVYRLTIRWRPGILTSDRISYSGDPEPLNIRSAVDLDGRRRWLVIHADTEA
ncbi:head-tail adaptor protein [Sphingomonas dokdonensis]|uniref:Phage head-tail joining protein n=1 Tax=Sphingomonas dokdonensis TaxID=344880 RepID=A0A245ZD44_9SPHN|nr:head-tail adaptor protein [Sphingomonas dokdonensis]OWK27576.1 phage head-tail joining protein [Sphingomonas dokdonensis]